MIIECSHCQARYQYDPARFEGRPSKKIRCAKCHEVFEISNPDAVAGAPEPAPASRPQSAASSSPEHDLTMSRGRRTSGGSVETPPVPDPPPDTSGREALGIPKDLRFSVAITDGADSARVFRIEKPRVTIGRSGADIALNDVEASREHAALEIRGRTVLLRDLGSTNGTILEGRRLSEPAEIQNQQEFVIGLTTLMLIVTIAD
ncbi:MAG TPA: FHA domain-containing protein [Thermoanaerobaculia bacterium]|nr:FHA domain-containing protein [Thermoanaerobaculia bacterium]